MSAVVTDKKLFCIQFCIYMFVQRQKAIIQKKIFCEFTEEARVQGDGLKVVNRTFAQASVHCESRNTVLRCSRAYLHASRDFSCVRAEIKVRTVT